MLSVVRDIFPALPRPAATTDSRRLEIPTLGVALAIYSGFGLLTWYFRDLPIFVAAPAGAFLLTWYGSLQHETIHGHPTSSRHFNRLLASLPLTLWIPYAIYRATHLQHHRHEGRHLTDVSRDPESFYLRAGTLAKAGAVARVLYSINCTLAGRLVVGPAIAMVKFGISEVRMIKAGDKRRLLIWARHSLGVAVVVAWTVGVCRVPFLVYAALVVYPSVSLSQLRSFAEHRADDESHRRTAAVEAGLVWSLVFLNNNLHIAHHAHRKLPWYELPRVWRQMRDAAIASGIVLQGGYGQVLRDYLFEPVISVEHPASTRDDV
jgi:fatty acid desaturase